MQLTICLMKVDWFFNKATHWQEEFKAPRMLVLNYGLVEELNGNARDLFKSSSRIFVI